MRRATDEAGLGGEIVREPVPSRLSRTSQAASWLLPFATLAALVGIWELVTVVFDIRTFVVPSPSDIAREFGDSHEVLPGHFWTTLEETLLGFLLAAVAGILLAVLIAYSRILERTIYPLLLALQSVPKVAVAPLLVLWMGFGAGPKIVMVFLLALFPIVISTATGLKQTPPEFIDLIRSLSASQLQTFWKVRFPAATPHVFVGLKVGITLAVIGAVIGEFVGAREGLGFLIIISGANVNTSLAFVSIVLLSVMSIGLFYALVALERLLAPWGEHMREGE